jgi:hypothetical protein
MGIFAALGGDFPQFGQLKTPNGKVETPGKSAKARQWRAFLAVPERPSRTPDCVAGAGGIEPPNGGIKISLIIQ